MSAGAPPRPANVTPFPNGELGVVWQDGHESIYAAHALRCACACAHCIDEVSGEKTLRDETVAQDIKPVEVHPVGNYALSIAWSDGHATGIYSFERLRQRCPCEACSTSR